MPYISWISPAEFIAINDKVRDGTPEGINVFPAEYYIGINYIIVYKQIDSKIYQIILPIANGNVFFRGKLILVEDLLKDLLENFSAIQLMYPLEHHDEITIKLSNITR